MARPKKVKEDEVVTIVDDKNTEALLPQEVEPTGVEVIEEEKPVTYDPNEGDEVSEVEEKEVEKVNAKQPVKLPRPNKLTLLRYAAILIKT